MNMQQLMIQAQKMQRELKKAKDQLHEKEFRMKLIMNDNYKQKEKRKKKQE